MIEAIVFDIGGVLVSNSAPAIFKDIANEFGISYDEAVSAAEDLTPDHQRGKMSDKEFWQRFSKNVGKELPRCWEELWLRKYKTETKKDGYVLEVIRRLSNNGYKVGALTNTEKTHFEYNKRIGLFVPFNVVVASCEVGMRKPEDIRIYELTARKLGAEKENIVYVDDKKENLKYFGKLIHYEKHKQLGSELRSMNIKLGL